MDIKSFKELTVDQVLKMVHSGEMTAEGALEIEKQEKNRTTLIKELTEMINTNGNNTKQEEKSHSDKVKVTFIQNVKFDNERYKIGQQIEVEEQTAKYFVAVGVATVDR